MSTTVRQIARSFARNLLGVLGATMAIATPPPASAAILVSNDFDSYTLGPLPASGDWSTSISAIVTNNIASSGTQSLFMDGNPGVANAQARTVLLGTNLQLWVQADVHLYTPSVSEANGADLQLLGTNGMISADLRLIANPGGTYDVKVLRGGGLSSVITNLPVEAAGQFRTFMFGGVITNASTGAGWYSVYLNGMPLVTNVAYTPFSAGTLAIEQMQLFGDAQWNADSVRVSTTPLPEPSASILVSITALALVGWRRRWI